MIVAVPGDRFARSSSQITLARIAGIRLLGDRPERVAGLHPIRALGPCRPGFPGEERPQELIATRVILEDDASEHVFVSMHEHMFDVKGTLPERPREHRRAGGIRLGRKPYGERRRVAAGRAQEPQLGRSQRERLAAHAAGARRAAGADGAQSTGGGDPTRQETRDDVRTLVGGDTDHRRNLPDRQLGPRAPTTAVVGRHFVRGEHANGPSAITCSTVAARVVAIRPPCSAPPETRVAHRVVVEAEDVDLGDVLVALGLATSSP